MTVQELIEELKKHNPNATVYVSDYDDRAFDINTIDCNNIDGTECDIVFLNEKHYE